MLFALDMEFVGQPHSGLDDAKNIARVVVTEQFIFIFYVGTSQRCSFLYSISVTTGYDIMTLLLLVVHTYIINFLEPLLPTLPSYYSILDKPCGLLD